MRTDLKVAPQDLMQRAARAPFWIKKNILHSDLTETAANTAETENLLTLPKRHGIIGVQSDLVTAFKNSADSEHNTTTLKVGHSGDDDAWYTAIELNENGTEVNLRYFGELTTMGMASATADTTVQAKFGSQASKALNDLDTGSVDIYLLIVDMDLLARGSTEED